MAANVDVIKAKVQSLLTEAGPVQLDNDGDFSIPNGSTRVFVRVIAHPDGDATVVSVFAPVLFDVPRTPALYEFLARNSNNLVFGHFALEEASDDSHAFLLIVHKLLGDYLDADELAYAVGGVAGSANHFDEDLQKQFGGKRLADI